MARMQFWPGSVADIPAGLGGVCSMQVVALPRAQCSRLEKNALKTIQKNIWACL